MPRSRKAVLGVRAAGTRKSSAPRAKRQSTAGAAPPASPPPEQAARTGSSSETSLMGDGPADDCFGDLAHALLDGGAACDPDIGTHPLMCDGDAMDADFGLLDKGYASVFGEETQQAAACAGQSPPSEACAGGVALHDALGFVAAVKSRFQREPRTYAAFLELLASYRADEAGAAETHAAVACLFRRNTDLADDFARFLPADVTPTPRQQRAAR